MQACRRYFRYVDAQKQRRREHIVPPLFLREYGEIGSVSLWMDAWSKSRRINRGCAGCRVPVHVEAPIGKWHRSQLDTRYPQWRRYSQWWNQHWRRDRSWLPGISSSAGAKEAFNEYRCRQRQDNSGTGGNANTWWGGSSPRAHRYADRRRAVVDECDRGAGLGLHAGRTCEHREEYHENCGAEDSETLVHGRTSIG
jgi:hypothetical protein